MSRILAVDLGFGSTKVCYKSEGDTLRYDKFISAVAKVAKNEVIKDTLAFDFNGVQYYLFDDAIKLPNNTLLDLMSYAGLREASPIIIRYLINKYGFQPDKLVLGLSMAMVQYSADYKKYVAEQLHMPIESIKLIPQGIGSKIAYDNYNANPEDPTQFTGNRAKNFLGVDIGFNTVDVYQVINGECSGNTVRGFEGQGLCVVADKLIKLVRDRYNKDLSIQNVKGVLETGTVFHRGNTYIINQEVDELTTEYLKGIIDLIEREFGKVIDNMDRMILVGGGAALIKKYSTSIHEVISSYYKGDFIIIPQSPEFYNVLGYYIAGTK